LFSGGGILGVIATVAAPIEFELLLHN
jgi:hypothetical protein